MTTLFTQLRNKIPNGKLPLSVNVLSTLRGFFWCDSSLRSLPKFSNHYIIDLPQIQVTTHFQLNIKFYPQTEGIPMGLLIAALIAELTQQCLEENNVKNALHKFWTCCVDVALVVLGNSVVETIFLKKIRFKVYKEGSRKKSQFFLLDSMFHRKTAKIVETSVIGNAF